MACTHCTGSRWGWPVHRRDPQLFYTLLVSHAEEVLPFVYTPAVGEACQRYHALPLTPRGLYLRATDAGRFLERLRAWPRQDIRCAAAACEEACLLGYHFLCFVGANLCLCGGGCGAAAPERHPARLTLLLPGWWW